MKRATFNGFWLPLLLLLPQLIITFIFFLWPASQAIYQSVLLEDAFGLSSRFVGLDNFKALLTSSDYLDSIKLTAVFSLTVAFCAMSISLLLAVMADRVIRGATAYKSLLVWPYAVAPVVAGAMWWFLFNPRIGIVAYYIQLFGYDWNHTINGWDAQILVVVAAVWKQISYNFLFFLAGLQAIPKSLIEAAAIDGASPFKRFWTVVFPLLSPTGFFLLVVNIVYAFFDTFGIIHATTRGGPARATEILVYKLFNDGFIGLDLGGSAAQSVVLMVIVVALTVAQFRYIERKVEY
ncbi:MAG: sn-glycerol-3-phosphate ABC transporter permease UgpA [Hyphomicrobiaceae bacterium]